jgi:hypothetical protein
MPKDPKRDLIFQPLQFKFNPSTCTSAGRNEAISSAFFQPVYHFKSEHSYEYTEIKLSVESSLSINFRSLHYDELCNILLNTCINYKLYPQSVNVVILDEDMNNLGGLNRLHLGKSYIFSHDGCEHRFELQNSITCSKTACIYLSNTHRDICNACKTHSGRHIVLDCSLLSRVSWNLCDECLKILKDHTSGSLEFIEINSLI